MDFNDPVGNRDALTGELTIDTIFWPDYMKKITDHFMLEHPDVKVNIRSSEQVFHNIAELGEMTDAMLTELMSGGGADIYSIEMISAYRYADSGLFEDLYTYMKGDPSFSLEDYYTNILCEYEYKGQLFWLPQAFTYYLFLMNMEVVDGLSIELLEGMSYTDIKNIYDRAMESNLLNETSVLDQSPLSEIAFNEYENGIYLDTDAMTASLDSEGFVRFLKDRKALPFTDRGGGIIPPTEPFEFVGAESLIHMLRATFLDWDFISASSVAASKPIILLSSDGKNTFSGIGINMAISSASEKKDLAWEFLKFLIGEKQYEFQEKQSPSYFENFPYYYAMPINRKNFMKLADYYAHGDKGFISSMDAINRSLNKKSFYDVQLDMALSHILEDYNKDLISAEECARQMQDRAYIFFNE